MRASPGRLAGRRGRSDQVDLTCPDLLPSSLPIANVGALTELPVLAREQRNDWLGQQRVVMSSYRRGQRRGQARAAPARRRRPGAAPLLAISSSAAARRKHDREDQMARMTPQRRLFLHRGHHLCPASRLAHSCWTATQPACTGGSPAPRSAHRGPGSEGCLPRRPGMPPGCAGRATGRLPPRRPDPRPPRTSVRRSSRRLRRRAFVSRRTGPALQVNGEACGTLTEFAAVGRYPVP